MQLNFIQPNPIILWLETNTLCEVAKNRQLNKMHAVNVCEGVDGGARHTVLGSMAGF